MLVDLCFVSEKLPTADIACLIWMFLEKDIVKIKCICTGTQASQICCLLYNSIEYCTPDGRNF